MMSDIDTAIQNLRDAERQITRALLALDESKSDCPTCRRATYVSFDDHQMAERLRAALSRCQGVRHELGGK